MVGCRNGSWQLCIVERLSSASYAQCPFHIYARATNASGSMRHNGTVILNEIVDSRPQLQICFAGIREWTLCALRALLWNSAHGAYGNRVRASVINCELQERLWWAQRTADGRKQRVERLICSHQCYPTQFDPQKIDASLSRRTTDHFARIRCIHRLFSS